ncbi:MAG: bifunctional histidinol-phosphatase/imidazoleglycerol-phosphate dehydratase HisB [Bacteroidales bacterium]|nr:bifunctional histidinol-phosphatase/imidazoleglycerol-phosphate dehydratase HisB [Bacteroidales bacterium]
MKKAIFIDRDGTLLREPADEQIDALEKVEFVPGAISGLRALTGLGYELVMASNQDGLGTPAFPEETFRPAQNLLLRTLEGEGVVFDDILIDPSMPEDDSPNRKPRTGMFGKYLDGSYDLAASWVVGDRETDRQLAANLGARALILGELSWEQIAETIRSSTRSATVARKTAETDIYVRVDLDGRGPSGVDTGLKFFDHMLSQLITHGGIALEVRCKGDLEVDEHHTIEDVGIALGEALRQALGDKRGIERYGFALPMDESRAIVLLDFGGRSELVWDVVFTREYVGDVPTEMFRHFFKSLSDAMRANLYVQARGENNHHLAEAVFKAFARSLRQAVRRDVFRYDLPSSKGLL